MPAKTTKCSAHVLAQRARARSEQRDGEQKAERTLHKRSTIMVRNRGRREAQDEASCSSCPRAPSRFVVVRFVVEKVSSDFQLSPTQV
jgi:hypothetical protein